MATNPYHNIMDYTTKKKILTFPPHHTKYNQRARGFINMSTILICNGANTCLRCFLGVTVSDGEAGLHDICLSSVLPGNGSPQAKAMLRS